jgi:F-box interacting protein
MQQVQHVSHTFFGVSPSWCSILHRYGTYGTYPCNIALHGLLLAYCQRPEDQEGYYVCNPSTGAALRLPDTKEPRKMNPQRGTVAQPQPPCYMDVAYGLGYSSASSEYKVVRIFSDDEDTGAAPWCEVFVLGTPAYWRPTAQQPPLCIVDEEESAVFLNGRLHFLRLDGAILTLDINDETFASLPPPAASPPAQFDINLGHHDRARRVPLCLPWG